MTYQWTLRSTQNPGRGTQTRELRIDQSRVQARGECTVGDGSTDVGRQGTAADDAINLRRRLRTRRPPTLPDL